MNIFLDAVDGQLLRKVTASTGNTIEDPETTVIPDNGYSETFTGSDCKDFALLIIFSAAATGTVIVQEVIDQEASVAGETFETITATAERVARWSAGELLPGHFRIKNTSGQNATVSVKKQIH